MTTAKFNVRLPDRLLAQLRDLAHELDIDVASLLRDGACLVLAEAREAREGRRPSIPSLEPLRPRHDEEARPHVAAEGVKLRPASPRNPGRSP